MSSHGMAVQHTCGSHLATRDSAPHLSQNGKVGLMGGQRKHDQVCIQAVQTVASVGVPPWAPTLLPEVGHDLVLTLSRGIGIRQDHLQPANDLRDPQQHVIAS